MKIVFALILLSCPLHVNGAIVDLSHLDLTYDSDGNGDKKDITHYTTGILDAITCKRALAEISKLGQLVSKKASIGQRIAVRNQLVSLGLDGNTIEEMLKAGAIVIKTKDHAIFLTKKEFDYIIQDSFPIEGNKVLVLPGNSEEVDEYLAQVSGCYEDERLRDEALNELEKARNKVKA